jgi:hypothetical protein
MPTTTHQQKPQFKETNMNKQFEEAGKYHGITYAPEVQLFSVIVPRVGKSGYCGHFATLNQAIAARDAAEVSL